MEMKGSLTKPGSELAGLVYSAATARILVRKSSLLRFPPRIPLTSMHDQLTRLNVYVVIHETLGRHNH